MWNGSPQALVGEIEFNGQDVFVIANQVSDHDPQVVDIKP